MTYVGAAELHNLESRPVVPDSTRQQSAERPGPDLFQMFQGAYSACKEFLSGTALENAGVIPNVTLRAKSREDVLTDSSSSAEDRLRAVESLARSGVTEVSLKEPDGSTRVCRLEVEEASGGRSLVHLFTTDENGKERVVLRGVLNVDGSVERQRDGSGRPVDFVGSWWLSRVGKDSALTPQESQFIDMSESYVPEPEHRKQRPVARRNRRFDDGQSHAAFSENSLRAGDTMFDPRVVSANTARGTGYYPSWEGTEGGYHDRNGGILYTLQEYLAGQAPYVSVAMDVPAARYGTLLRIPELEAKYGRQIPFRVVDTGSDFEGMGRSRIDICTESKEATYDEVINGKLTLLFMS